MIFKGFYHIRTWHGGHLRHVTDLRNKFCSPIPGSLTCNLVSISLVISEEMSFENDDDDDTDVSDGGQTTVYPISSLRVFSSGGLKTYIVDTRYNCLGFT